MKQLLLLFLCSQLLCAGESLTDQYGKAHDWDTLVAESGGILIVDFAAAWCKPCWKMLPKLQSFVDEHPKLGVVVLSQDEKPAGRDRLVGKLGLTMPVLWDEGHLVAERLKPEGMPATFILNDRGEVVYRHVGSGDGQWFEFLKEIDALLD